MKSLFLVLIIIGPTLSFAAVQKLAANGGEVDILAKGRPSFLRVQGKGSPATGQLSIDGDKISGQLEFDLASLETGIETRDHHMKEKYLEVEKYPKATLTIKSVGHLATWNIQTPALKEDQFEGMLTLHGVTRPVSGKFSMSEKRSVIASFTVKLTDYQVAIPQFGGVTIADDVDIHVTIDSFNIL